MTVERFEITGGSGAGAHGIEHRERQTAANLGVVRYNLIHDTPADDGIRLSDADSIVDIYNNFIFNTNVGIRLLVDMSPDARVNIFSNTVYNSTTAGIASRGHRSGGAYVRQTSLRVSLRQNIAHSNPVDFDVARAFDEAYFCTDHVRRRTPTCTNITTQIGDASVNYQTAASPRPRPACTWARPHKFRGVSAWLVVGGRAATARCSGTTGTEPGRA